MRKIKTKGLFSTVTTLLIALILTFSIGLGVAAEDNEVSVAAEIGEKKPEVAEGSDEMVVSGDNSQYVEQNPINTGESDKVGGDLSPNYGQNADPSGDYEMNIFEEIYAAVKANADKIFSVLAFVGTLIVGVCYKSGLLPLLRDALSKLKGAIDGVKADSETTKAETGERLREISCAVESIEEQLSAMKWQYESYEDICRDRESLRLILQGQIDMLYSIFMTSALPQYQKDEVGERISEMREELKNYESGEKN